jgi:hypothetical protein
MEKKGESKGERRKESYNADKKNYFPITLDSLCYICNVHGENAIYTSGKIWWLEEIVICEVYGVSISIYFTSGENHLKNSVITCRTAKSKGKSFIGLYRS